MKAIKIFFLWSGVIWWILMLSMGGYLWQGGYFYAKNAPLFDALLCAEDTTPPYAPLNGSGLYLPPSCLRGIYQRGSSTDITTINSDPKYLDAVLRLPEDGETEKLLAFWLARGADINIQSNMTGATLLELHAKLDDVDSVELLIKHGARTDTRNKAGQTPLQAVRWYAEKLDKKPNEEIVKLLGG